MKKELLAPREQREIKRPFPLVQDLFHFAREHGINESGFNSDTGGAHTVQPLPEAFFSLVAEYPGTYFVTAYEDRRNSYYAEETRHQMVRISTTEDRKVTDEKTREIDIKLKDEYRADRIEICVREAVMDKSFGRINQAGNGEVNRPNGSMRYTYERDEVGKKYPKLIECHRMDEGLFVMDGLEKPVRWVRDVRREIENDKTHVTEYQDYYIVGRGGDGKKDERASIKTVMRGDMKHPKLVEIEIGFGDKASARRLIDDQKSDLVILVHNEEMLSIVKTDPAYEEIFKETPKKEKIVSDIVSRIQMLLDEWDKLQSVYEDVGVKMLESVKNGE